MGGLAAKALGTEFKAKMEAATAVVLKKSRRSFIGSPPFTPFYWI